MEKHCRKCGRELKDIESRKRGFGPVCGADHDWKEPLSVTEILYPKKKSLKDRITSLLKAD